MSRPPNEFEKKPFFTTHLPQLFRETKIFPYKSSGPGGQRKNKKATAIKLHHIPSGLWIIATEERSQAQNKQLAFRRLQKRLAQFNTRKKLRIPSKMPFALKEEILRRKRMRSEKKKMRKNVDVTEDF